MAEQLMAASPVTIVAETAQGYEGDPTVARLLVRAAARGGADLVKFQLVYADELAVPSYRWYELFRGLEMPREAWAVVQTEAERAGVGLAFDVFGMRSLEEAVALGARAVKLHVTDFFNAALIDAALATASCVHVSQGGIAFNELREYLARIGPNRLHKVVLLSGFQAEPTELADNHLARLGALKAAFPDLGIGWMDHSSGDSDEASWLGVLAVPYGVSVIEKHLTLSRPLEMEDFASAVDADAFQVYVRRIRAAEAAVGSATLQLTDAEEQYRRRALKVVVARERIARGSTIEATAVTLKRAALEDGEEPCWRLDQVVGRRTERDLLENSVVYPRDAV